MSKTVVFLFHDDGAALQLGSRLAEGLSSAGASDVEVEVFCFGPAQHALAAQGVRVTTCRTAAEFTGVAEEMAGRGIVLDSPRDRVLQYAREGAVVLNF